MFTPGYPIIAGHITANQLTNLGSVFFSKPIYSQVWKHVFFHMIFPSKMWNHGVVVIWRMWGDVPFWIYGDFNGLGCDVFTHSSVDIDLKNSQASSSWLWGHNLRKWPSIRWEYCEIIYIPCKSEGSVKRGRLQKTKFYVVFFLRLKTLFFRQRLASPCCSHICPAKNSKKSIKNNKNTFQNLLNPGSDFSNCQWLWYLDDFDRFFKKNQSSESAFWLPSACQSIKSLGL